MCVSLKVFMTIVKRSQIDPDGQPSRTVKSTEMVPYSTIETVNNPMWMYMQRHQ